MPPPLLHHAPETTFFSSFFAIYLLFFTQTGPLDAPQGGCPGPLHHPHPPSAHHCILYRECKATFSLLLMYFLPQFTEATDIITLESVIFPMRFCVYIKNS